MRKEVGHERLLLDIYLPLAELFQAEGDYGRAMQLYRRSRAGVENDPSSWGSYLLGLATLAEALGQHELVVRLLGTTETVVDTTGYRLFPDDRENSNRLAETARANLGTERLDAARQLGQGQGFELAVEEAISLLDEVLTLQDQIPPTSQDAG